MIKITSNTIKNEERGQVKKRNSLSSTSDSGKSFKTQFESILGLRNEDNSIEGMMDSLREREQRFLDNQTIEEMNLYRTTVQRILKRIIEESTQAKTIKGRTTIKGQAPDVNVVEIVNQKLLDLSALITSKKPFALMKTMDEIRGLILDQLR